MKLAADLAESCPPANDLATIVIAQHRHVGLAIALAGDRIERAGLDDIVVAVCVRSRSNAGEGRFLGAFVLRFKLANQIRVTAHRLIAPKDFASTITGETPDIS